MDMKAKYVERLQQLCSLFEIGFDMDPDIYSETDFAAYKSSVGELEFLTGRSSRNTYLEQIEEIRNELPFPILNESGL